jgi:hypothetical protein
VGYGFLVLARFESPHDSITLITVAGRVLRAARPHDPNSVTQREYDATRQSLGYGSTPRADKLAKRFRLAWVDFKDRTLGTPHATRAVAVAGRQHRRRLVTRGEAISAVRRAAAFLDTDTLTPAQYEKARVAVERRARARHLHGQHLIPWPYAHTIRRKLNFAEILADAGLRPPPKNELALLSRTDAVCHFVEHYGFIPRSTDLYWFGRTHGIQFVQPQSGEIKPSIDEARARFTDAGRWFPPSGPRRLKRPDNWQHFGDGSPTLTDLAARYPRKRGRGDGYRLEDLRKAIATAWAALPSGQPLTVVTYIDIHKGLGLPAYGTVQRIAKKHGTSFSELVRDAVDA